MTTFNTLCCVLVSQVTCQGNHIMTTEAGPEEDRHTLTRLQDGVHTAWCWATICWSLSPLHPHLPMRLSHSSLSVPISVALSHTRTKTHPLSLCMFDLHPHFCPSVKTQAGWRWEEKHTVGCTWVMTPVFTYMWHALKATAHMQWSFPHPPSKQPNLWKVRFTALLCAAHV